MGIHEGNGDIVQDCLSPAKKNVDFFVLHAEDLDFHLMMLRGGIVKLSREFNRKIDLVSVKGESSEDIVSCMSFVRKALERGMHVFVVTDHELKGKDVSANTVIREVLALGIPKEDILINSSSYGKNRDTEVIPGIEIREEKLDAVSWLKLRIQAVLNEFS